MCHNVLCCDYQHVAVYNNNQPNVGISPLQSYMVNKAMGYFQDSVGCVEHDEFIKPNIKK